ncbi:MAG: UDP-3-O-acyl-N-acetylglucosamine deacetylase [Pseudomonadota bacterium]
MQSTIKQTFTIKGIGLHTGRPVTMKVMPSAAELGIWFKRTDRVSGDPYVAAQWDSVQPSKLCTRLENADGVTVSTVESSIKAF